MLMMDGSRLACVDIFGRGSITTQLTVIHNANMCYVTKAIFEKWQSGKLLAGDTNYLTSMGVQSHKLIMLSYFMAGGTWK